MNDIPSAFAQHQESPERAFPIADCFRYQPLTFVASEILVPITHRAAMNEALLVVLPLSRLLTGLTILVSSLHANLSWSSCATRILGTTPTIFGGPAWPHACTNPNRERRGGMPSKLFLSLSLLFACFGCGQADAQYSRLDCRGTIRDTPAQLSGLRHFAVTNSLGDGYVQFAGTVSAGGITGQITYEGGTQHVPFSGSILIPQGTISVGVLDNTGGQMIIYGRRPSLGPPETIGRFVCEWQNVGR